MVCLGIYSRFAVLVCAPSPDVPAVGSQPPIAAIPSDEMQVAELNPEYLGVSYFQLMEAVGANISREISARTATKPTPRIHIISGPGKNGGDGFAVARHL